MYILLLYFNMINVRFILALLLIFRYCNSIEKHLNNPVPKKLLVDPGQLERCGCYCEKENNLMSNQTYFSEFNVFHSQAHRKKSYQRKKLSLKTETTSSLPLQTSSLSQKLSVFLDASSHLYKRVCPSIRPSVRRLVGP